MVNRKNRMGIGLSLDDQVFSKVVRKLVLKITKAEMQKPRVRREGAVPSSN
jgi:hypothetical protein